MTIKATVLCENCVFHNMSAMAEHGWAVYIETEQGNFLFDTGLGNSIINNARFFNKDLKKVNGIIISHHHRDHTGGLLAVLEEKNEEIKVYSHPDLFKNSFSSKSGVKVNAGIPFRREILENRGANFQFNTDFTEIAPGLMLSGEIPRKTNYEKGDRSLLVKSQNGYIQDKLLDDQTLIIKTAKGLFIILGCSHSGIINIINYAIKKTGQEHIHTIIGGTHLGPADKETREKSIQALKQFDIERIGVSHCTGLETSMRLYYEFGERFFFCNVGTVVEV